jgi:hypothetical protein
VTGQLDIKLIDSSVERNTNAVESNRAGSSQRQADVYRITNSSSSIVDTHLLLIARGLAFEIELENGSGRTGNGDPYRRLFLRDGVLLPGQSIVARLVFKRRSHAPPVSYTLRLLSGQGNP